MITYNGKTPVKAQKGAAAFGDAYVLYKTAQAKTDINGQVGALQPGINALTKQLSTAQTSLDRQDPNSGRARSLNVTIGRLTTNLAQLQAQQDTLRSQTVDGGQVLSPATLPTKTAGTGLLTNAAIGLLAGLVVGLILTFTRDRFDEQVREPADLQQVLSVPNLGSIPVLPDRHRKRDTSLVTLHAPEGPHADAFRRLRSAVLLMIRANDAKIVAITSANAGEGKSTVAANLAVTLAQAGNSVCLVSADVRRPTLDQFFQVPGHTGLMDVLDGSVSLDEALVQVAGLSLLTSGRPHANPTDLLQSVLMETTMTSLRANFDYTVVDTPPVLGRRGRARHGLHARCRPVRGVRVGDDGGRHQRRGDRAEQRRREHHRCDHEPFDGVHDAVQGVLPTVHVPSDGRPEGGSPSKARAPGESTSTRAPEPLTAAPVVGFIDPPLLAPHSTDEYQPMPPSVALQRAARRVIDVASTSAPRLSISEAASRGEARHRSHPSCPRRRSWRRLLRRPAGSRTRPVRGRRMLRRARTVVDVQTHLVRPSRFTTAGTKALLRLPQAGRAGAMVRPDRADDAVRTGMGELRFGGSETAVALLTSPPGVQGDGVIDNADIAARARSSTRTRHRPRP